MSYLELDTEPELERRNIALSKLIAEKLHKEYPGHLWAVQADIEQGMATVRNLALSGEWGFYLKLSEVVNDPYLKKVKWAGGEILERYRLHRGRFEISQLQELERDRLTGNFVADSE